MDSDPGKSDLFCREKTAWLRLLTSSFTSTLCTWFFTVETSIDKSRAICLLDNPTASKPAICCSRWVRQVCRLLALPVSRRGSLVENGMYLFFAELVRFCNLCRMHAAIFGGQ